MSEIKPTTTATSNDGKKKRRSKVSFSEEVISKDKFGDGNKVLVKEEPGVFLSLLGQKKVVKTNENEINGAVVDRVATISFGGVDDDNDDLLKQKLAYSEKQDGNIIMQSPTEIRAGSTSDGVEYDNLIVKIGILKIGHE